MKSGPTLYSAEDPSSLTTGIWQCPPSFSSASPHTPAFDGPVQSYWSDRPEPATSIAVLRYAGASSWPISLQSACLQLWPQSLKYFVIQVTSKFPQLPPAIQSRIFPACLLLCMQFRSTITCFVMVFHGPFCVSTLLLSHSLPPFFCLSLSLT